MKHFAIYGRTRVTITAIVFVLAMVCVARFATQTDAQKFRSGTIFLAGTVSGRVFQDFNGNGSYDTSGGTAAAPTSVDIGVGGVTVSAYDASGVLRGTATTAADGTYTLSAAGTGPYRVEFTTIPSGYSPSARSTDSVSGGTATNAGSTVQFIPDGTTGDVNLALNRPQDYCADNPDVCSQVYGLGAGEQADSIFTVPYNAGSTRTTGGSPINDFNFPGTTTPGNASLATTDEVGTTFGLAYNRRARKIYAATFMKKHAKFGPGGTGAIYQIDRATGAISEYVNLNTVFGANTAGVDPHNPLDYNTDNGQATWDAVGKVAFGGAAISEDDANLFVMNLANRRLYRIPTSGALNSTTIQSAAFPATMPNCSNAADVRPFAVTWYEGTIYVGAVCSRETDAAAISTDLRAYVYTADPSTLAFSAAPVVQFQLNYTRLETDPGLSAAWRNWRTTYQTISGSHFIYPQPMLTDIDFDRGNMIVGLRDRNGDQSGYNSASNPNNSAQLFKGITAGDMLRLCGSPALGWTLENNGRCAGIGAATQGTNEGPGGGEYYYQDNYHPNGNPHDEVALGAASQIPGRNVLIAAVFDPIFLPTDNFYDRAGFRWFVNSTGAQNRGYQAFSAGDFGKANGLGNAQTLCEAAPIEIGNRLWEDTNRNGAQDPGENPIAGVTVRLYQGAVLVGTAVTDANGEYYFVGSGSADSNTLDNIGLVNGGVRFSTAYQVRLDDPANYNPGGPLNGRYLAYRDSTLQAGDDEASDSDAVAVINPPGSPAGTYPVIALTTGAPGANDHRFDVGFMLAPTAAPVSVEGRVVTAGGTGIRGARVTLTDGDGNVHVASTSSFGYFRIDGVPAGGNGYVEVAAKRYTFSVPALGVNLTADAHGVVFYADQLR